MSGTTKTRVLVVGGGFGGVRAALELSKCSSCEVTLLSDDSHFRYYPGLYHTATGGKRAGTQLSLNTIMTGRNVRLELGTAVSLDRARKEVITQSGQHLPYDSLVLALGSTTNYFGIHGLAEYSYGIKSTEDAERFKRHLHQQLDEQKTPDANYIIVGGGPTGVELAGALPGYLRNVMRRHGITPRKLHIRLVEAAPVLLPRSPKRVQMAVLRRLQRLGITVMTNTAVGGETADTLTAGDTPLKTHTVVWTAGVTNNPFFQQNGFSLTDHGKVAVDDYLQAEPDIYVIGDNAQTPYSGMAQTALYDGAFVGRNICRTQTGQTPDRYKPHQPVTVIPVGHNWAAVAWKNWSLSGWMGGILHYFVDLIGFYDVENNWPKADEQWIRSKGESDAEVCAICAKQQPPAA